MLTIANATNRYSHDELLRVFQNNAVTHLNDDKDKDTSCSSSSKHRIQKTQWSCILDYCEAISTHSSSRYALFPLPITKLQALVTNEIVPLFANSCTSITTIINNIMSIGKEEESLH